MKAKKTSVGIRLTETEEILICVALGRTWNAIAADILRDKNTLSRSEVFELCVDRVSGLGKELENKLHFSSERVKNRLKIRAFPDARYG